MSTHAATRDRVLARTALCSYLVLWAATLLTALVAVPFSGALHALLGLRLAPHRGLSVALAILARNLRVAALPFMLAAANRPGSRRWLGGLGDVVVAASLGGNVLLAGLALAAYGPGLLVLLPHWSFEWAGFALALTAWRRARTGHRDPVELALLGISCALCLVAGALVETYATPGI
jgi:hypothetical protein